MTRLISLAHLTALHLAPPDLIELAAQTGYDAVGLRLLGVSDTSPAYPLMDDPAMMRATLAALRRTGLRVLDIEFLRMTPTTDIASLGPFLGAGATLGARHVICAPYDPDLQRMSDRLAALAERCAPYGLSPVLEFFPWTHVPDLCTAIRAVEATGDPRVGILVDALHLDRSDSDPALLRDQPPARFPFLHLCDAAVAPPYALNDLLATAREARLPPGAGQINLTALLGQFPDTTPIALEVPMIAHAARYGIKSVAADAMAGMRRILNRNP